MSNRICCAFIVLLISGLISISPVIWIQANRIFALDKDVVYHHYEKCKKQPVEANILDMEELNEEELLVIEHDLNGLFTNGPNSSKQGRLLRVIDVGFGSPKFKQVDLHNYPTDLGFRPFGLHYQDSKIFVLNQAFHMGGPRVDIFDYKNESAHYTGSVLLPAALGGTFGDLVIHKNFIYLSQYSQVPFESSPNPLPFTSILHQFFNDIAQIHQAGVFRCPLVVNDNVECVQMKTSTSASVTSLIKDDENMIWASFSSVDYNCVERYEISSNGDLKFSEKVSLRDQAGRLSYSKNVARVYAGALPWPYLGMTSQNAPAGVVEVRKLMDQKSYNQRRIFMQENMIKGITAAARIGNYALASSFMENSVLVCLIVDP